MRYITPEDVAEFVSNAHKGVKNGLINPNPYDIEMFAVESAKRFIEDHGCVPFDASAIGGNAFASERHETLQDLLLIHANDVYRKEVCCPYEQKARYEVMKDGDLKIINDIHFVANMKKIVDQFPSLIEQMDGAEMYRAQPLVAKVFRALIEEFVLFASTLNMITVGNMVKFAIPDVTFETVPDVNDHEGEITQESVDDTKNAPIYFCFAQGKTPVISKAIQKATKSEFSHLSIAFDASLSNMYSFAKGGVRKEDIKGEYYKNIDVTIYGAYIAKDKVDKMKAICEDYIKNADKTKFDVGILLKKLIKKDGSLPKNEYRQVCTTFINKMLKDVDVELTDKNIPSPKEMKESVDSRDTQFIQLYDGKAYDYNSNDAKKSLITFKTSANSKAINEYVTECCVLKTNSMNIDSRIPFYFNMRDIVLKSTTDDLSDVKNALEFILNDSRSPIHELLVKYATMSKGSYDGNMVKQAFLTHSHGWSGDRHTFSNDATERLNERTAFFTNDDEWLDKIVYGDPHMDTNYRDDLPGNQHHHSIRYDISTIYNMFSCHHNDNEHLANNVVKIANVMMYLVRDYNNNHDVPWESLRDILAVFGEIITKSILMLYHNNNNSLVYRDDMNDTMVPGYMYCEQFVMEVDNPTGGGNPDTPKADPNSNKAPKIENTTKGLKEGTKMQNLMAKIKQILQKFAEYIRNTISQIFPKFNQGHKAEIEWIKNHKELNAEIGKAISEGKFTLKINDYPHFNIKGEEIIKLGTKAENLAKQLENESSREEWYKANNTKPGVDKNELVNIMQDLVYDQVKDKITVENVGKENNELVTAVRNYVMYSNPNGPENAEKDVTLNGADAATNIWQKDIIDALTNDIPKLLEESCKNNIKALEKLSNCAKKLADEAEKKEKQGQQSNQNANTGDPNKDKQDAQNQAAKDETLAQALTTAIQRLTKDCYNATVSCIMKDVYGKTYNMYRSIVNEYQRQKAVGVEGQESNNNANGAADQNANPNG